MRDVACEAVNERREPCGMPRQKDSPFCYIHDPARKAERAAARRRGGLTTARTRHEAESEPFPIYETADVQNLLAIAAGDIVAQPPSIARARAAAYVSGVALKLIELTEVEQRIAAVERALGERDGWR